jgi:hypothetical protein
MLQWNEKTGEMEWEERAVLSEGIYTRPAKAEDRAQPWGTRGSGKEETKDLEGASSKGMSRPCHPYMDLSDTRLAYDPWWHNHIAVFYSTGDKYNLKDNER